MKKVDLSGYIVAKYLKSAKDVAVKAGNMLKKNAHRVRTISYKGTINLVTEMDIKSEKMIVAELSKQYPTFSFLAEEGTDKDNKSDYKWIIDPLDGTTNYAHQFPFWCVSIALEYRGEIIVGVIYNPLLDELFTATMYDNSRLNSKKIYVSKSRKLTRSLLATGFPYDVHTSPVNNLDYFQSFQLNALAVRRAGSAALDLCYLACGRFDGFWELKLHAWDTAAGVLIVKQAGGKVTNFAGNKYSIYDQELLASNSLIHNQMIKIIEKSNS